MRLGGRVVSARGRPYLSGHRPTAPTRRRLPGVRAADRQRGEGQSGGPLEGRGFAGALLVGVTLLAPRVGRVVVAALFPESPPVPGQVLHGPDPLDALPFVPARPDHPDRVPVLRSEFRSVAVGSQQGVVLGEIRDLHIGAVTEVCPDHDIYYSCCFSVCERTAAQRGA